MTSNVFAAGKCGKNEKDGKKSNQASAMVSSGNLKLEITKIEKGVGVLAFWANADKFEIKAYAGLNATQFQTFSPAKVGKNYWEGSEISFIEGGIRCDFGLNKIVPFWEEVRFSGESGVVEVLLYDKKNNVKQFMSLYIRGEWYDLPTLPDIPSSSAGHISGGR